MTTQESGRTQEKSDTKVKQSNQTKQKQPKKKKKKRSTQQRLLAALAKWMFIIFCLLFSVILGLVVGYSIIGEGSVGDVFDINTWKHLYDLIFTN